MKRNNEENEEIVRPAPYNFSFSDMDLVYEKPAKVRVMIDSDSNVPRDGSRGDIIFTRAKNKEVLGIHDGREWKYAMLYTIQELKDFNRKINELEGKLLSKKRRK